MQQILIKKMVCERIRIGEGVRTSVSPTILISGWVKHAAGTLKWFRIWSFPETCSTTTTRAVPRVTHIKARKKIMKEYRIGKYKRLSPEIPCALAA